VNLNFVSDFNEIQLDKSDSLLLLGKKKDVRLVEYSHLSKPLGDLEIPKSVR
jgi:hypothetical protein